MHPIISKFPSDNFYDGKIKNDPSVEKEERSYRILRF